MLVEEKGPRQASSSIFLYKQGISSILFKIKLELEPGFVRVYAIPLEQRAAGLIDASMQKVYAEIKNAIQLAARIEVASSKERAMDAASHAMVSVARDVRAIKGDTSAIKQTTAEINAKITDMLARRVMQYEQNEDAIATMANQLHTLNDRISRLYGSGDVESAASAHLQVQVLQEQMRNAAEQVEHSLAGISEGVEKILATQAFQVDALKETLGSDWDKIRDAWNDMRSGKRSVKDVLKGAAKELGKRAVIKIVSAVTGGIVDFTKDKVASALRSM